MMKKLILFSIILTFNVFALDRIWDTRYTNGPEIRGQSKMVLGAGLRTGKDTDFFVPVHFQGSVNEDAEFGAKLFYYSDNTHLNIGAKAYLSPNSYIGLDVPFMIDKNFKGGLIVTYSKENHIAKIFSNLYELRAGFFEGVTGPDAYVKFETGFMPTLNFGGVFLAMAEPTSSFTAGHFQEDFMVDILPKLEVNISGTRLRLEFDFGILQESNNNQRSIGFYALIPLK